MSDWLPKVGRVFGDRVVLFIDCLNIGLVKISPEDVYSKLDSEAVTWKTWLILNFLVQKNIH